MAGHDNALLVHVDCTDTMQAGLRALADAIASLGFISPKHLSTMRCYGGQTSDAPRDNAGERDHLELEPGKHQWGQLYDSAALCSSVVCAQAIQRKKGQDRWVSWYASFREPSTDAGKQYESQLIMLVDESHFPADQPRRPMQLVEQVFDAASRHLDVVAGHACIVEKAAWGYRPGPIRRRSNEQAMLDAAWAFLKYPREGFLRGAHWANLITAATAARLSTGGDSVPSRIMRRACQRVDEPPVYVQLPGERGAVFAGEWPFRYSSLYGWSPDSGNTECNMMWLRRWFSERQVVP